MTHVVRFFFLLFVFEAVLATSRFSFNDNPDALVNIAIGLLSAIAWIVSALCNLLAPKWPAREYFNVLAAVLAACFVIVSIDRKAYDAIRCELGQVECKPK